MQFDQIPPTGVKRIVHTGTQFEQVRAALVEAGANTENAKREVEHSFGNNTNIVWCEYEGEQYRAYVPWQKYLAKTQQLSIKNRLISDVVSFVDDHIAAPARDMVSDDGEDTTVTLSLNEVNTLLSLLGMDQVNVEQEYRVTVNAAATYYVTVTATSEDHAADLAYDMVEDEFSRAADIYSDDMRYDGCSVDVIDVQEG